MPLKLEDPNNRASRREVVSALKLEDPNNRASRREVVSGDDRRVSSTEHPSVGLDQRPKFTAVNDAGPCKYVHGAQLNDVSRRIHQVEARDVGGVACADELHAPVPDEPPEPAADRHDVRAAGSRSAGAQRLVLLNERSILDLARRHHPNPSERLRHEQDLPQLRRNIEHAFAA